MLWHSFSQIRLCLWIFFYGWVIYICSICLTRKCFALGPTMTYLYNCEKHMTRSLSVANSFKLSQLLNESFRDRISISLKKHMFWYFWNQILVATVTICSVILSEPSYARIMYCYIIFCKVLFNQREIILYHWRYSINANLELSAVSFFFIVSFIPHGQKWWTLICWPVLTSFHAWIISVARTSIKSKWHQLPIGVRLSSCLVPSEFLVTGN